jgi:hypothetical protein
MWPQGCLGVTRWKRRAFADTARLFTRTSPRGAPTWKLRDVQLVLGLLPGTGDVQRPGGRDARLTRLDELRDGDVDDTLAAGLGAADAEQAVDLTAGTLARGPRELVRCCYSPLRTEWRAASFLDRSARPRVVRAGQTVPPSAVASARSRIPESSPAIRAGTSYCSS